jgi:hypothetical protein
MTRPASAALAVFALALAGTSASGCVSDVMIGMDRSPSSAGSGGGSGGTTAGLGGSIPGGGTGASDAGQNGEGGGAATGCVVALCGMRVYACGNCNDDDGDGNIDSADSQCLGPCDDTEDSYYPNIDGQNGSSCRQDCYFDRGGGTNDQCFSSFRCDPFSTAPDYPPSGDAGCAYDPDADIPATNATCAELSAAQPDACADNCGPLVPNGCDCFGCCELPVASGSYVWIGSNGGTCNEASVSDPSACRPCTPVPSCLNDCGPCEICAGRQTPGSDCMEGEAGQCPDGVTPCGLSGQAACSPGQYCITGCCQTEPR